MKIGLCIENSNLLIQNCKFSRSITGIWINFGKFEHLEPATDTSNLKFLPDSILSTTHGQQSLNPKSKLQLKHLDSSRVQKQGHNPLLSPLVNTLTPSQALATNTSLTASNELKNACIVKNSGFFDIFKYGMIIAQNEGGRIVCEQCVFQDM